MKKMKRHTKDMLMSAVNAIPLLLFIVFLFYTTQPATEANTYVTNENIIDIKLELPGARYGNNKLYIITANNRYTLNTGTSNDDVAYELAENILSGNQEFSIAVWKNLWPGISAIFGPEIWVDQVVDLRDHENVYWDIDSHNNNQKSDRIAAVIVSLLILLGYVWLCIWPYWPIKKKKKKKKTKVSTGVPQKVPHENSESCDFKY